ncbi:MAG TPA: EamA family transporter [Kofleriaceae bacterium]|nr:EamA family transporter [Kofleriaceae bacterium]
MLYVVIAAASWGTWSLFLYPAHLPPVITTPIMFIVMGATAWLISLREAPPTWDRSAARALAANTICDTVNVAAFFAALDTTTVAIAVITHYAAPIIVALLDPVRVRGARLAAVLALAGLAIILEPWRALDWHALIGAGLGLVSAFAYAGNVFAVRRLATKIGSARAVAYHSLLAGALLSPLLIVHAFELGVGPVARVAAGAASIGAISGVLFVVGLRRIGPARAAVLAFAEPLVAVLVGSLCWNQTLHPIAAVGGAMVLVAGVHVARQAR